MIRVSARRVALFGGVYSNHLALEATLADAAAAGVEEAICLGDLGAFGPNPDRACAIVRQAGIPVVQGNYDASIGHGLSDCRCGYTDPRDNHFAALSYRYTYARTSSAQQPASRSSSSSTSEDARRATSIAAVSTMSWLVAPR